MISENLIPIADLFEAHLSVSDLDPAVAFYGKRLGLPLARVFPERKVAESDHQPEWQNSPSPLREPFLKI